MSLYNSVETLEISSYYYPKFFLTAGALFLLSFLFLFSVPVATALTWNIDFTTATANDTVYWDGHPFDYLSLTFYNRSEIDDIITGNLTANLSGYVPYVGAIDDVDIGIYDIYANNGFFNNSINFSYLLSNYGGILTTVGDRWYLNDTDLYIEQNLEVDGNVTAAYFIGDGSGLTNLPGDADNDFHIFFNGSSYINITYNLTAGDVNNIEVPVEPGRKFIFGNTFT